MGFGMSGKFGLTQSGKPIIFYPKELDSFLF